MLVPIRVVLLHRSRFLADALAIALADLPRIRLLASTTDLREAAPFLAPEYADAVLVHAQDNLPAAVREIRGRCPALHVVALGVRDDLDAILAVIEAGAAGYLLENMLVEEAIRVIDSVSAGEPALPPRVVGALLGRVWALANAPGVSLSRLEKLSAREEGILEMIGRGLANKQIARALDLALCTVKNHVHHILDKLGVHRRADAVRCAHRASLSQPSWREGTAEDDSVLNTLIHGERAVE